MATIKNIHLLAHLMTDDNISELDAEAEAARKQSYIEFKVLSKDENSITVQTSQRKNAKEAYFKEKELIIRTKDLFSKVLARFKINVQALPYQEHHISKIDAEWLGNQMRAYNVKAKDIVKDTGLDKTNISAWVNGARDMSQIVKAMFYFYFVTKSSNK